MKGRSNHRRIRFLEQLETRDLFAGLDAEVLELKEVPVENVTLATDEAAPEKVAVVAEDGSEVAILTGLAEDGLEGQVMAFAMADDQVAIDKAEWIGDEEVLLEDPLSVSDGELVPIRYSIRSLAGDVSSDDGIEILDGEVVDGEVFYLDGVDTEWMERTDDSVVFMTFGGVLDEVSDGELPAEAYQTAVLDDVSGDVTFVVFNADNIADANWDGEVSPIDVLITSNAINRYGAVELTNENLATMAEDFGGAGLPFALDANDDGYLSPADVGLRVNRLNVLAEVLVAPLASAASRRMMIAPSSFLVVADGDLENDTADRTYLVDDFLSEEELGSDIGADLGDASADRVMGIMIGEPIWEDVSDESARKMAPSDELGDESEVLFAEEIDTVLADWA